MGAIQPRRADMKLAAPVNRVVDILRDVFGGNPSIDGPRWVLDPSRSVQAAFWHQFGPGISTDQRVQVGRGRQVPAHVTDIHGRQVAADAPRAEEPAALFFIDRDPLANWAHECTYVFLYDDGGVHVAERRWPPSASAELVSLPRPHDAP